jgi:hypothetical protein
MRTFPHIAYPSPPSLASQLLGFFSTEPRSPSYPIYVMFCCRAHLHVCGSVFFAPSHLGACRFIPIRGLRQSGMEMRNANGEGCGNGANVPLTLHTAPLVIRMLAWCYTATRGWVWRWA